MTSFFAITVPASSRVFRRSWPWIYQKSVKRASLVVTRRTHNQGCIWLETNGFAYCAGGCRTLDFYTRYCRIRGSYHDMAYSMLLSQRSMVSLYIMVKSSGILSKDVSEQLQKTVFRSCVCQRFVTPASPENTVWYVYCTVHSETFFEWRKTNLSPGVTRSRSKSNSNEPQSVRKLFRNGSGISFNCFGGKSRTRKNLFLSDIFSWQVSAVCNNLPKAKQLRSAALDSGLVVNHEGSDLG